MRSVFSSLLLVFLLTACLGKEIKSGVRQKDSLLYPVALNSILDSFPLNQLPFVIDSTYFDGFSAFDFEGGNLRPEAVKILSARFAFDDLSKRENYYMNSFLNISKAKSEGSFESFKATLESGMTENAVCNAIGRVEFGDTLAILLWEIQYKSMDTTPTYQGHHILGTLVCGGKTVACMHLGNKEQGADFPMSYEVYQLFKIDKFGWISVRNYSMSKEEDEVVENASTYLNYRVSGRGFKYVK